MQKQLKILAALLAVIGAGFLAKLIIRSKMDS